MNKFPVYSGIGVPEVWRYTGDVLRIYTLKRNEYVLRNESAVSPKATGSILTSFIQSSLELKRPVWIKRVREWAREPASE